MIKYTYLLIDLLAVVVPFIFSFHPKINFHKTWRAFFPAVLVSGTVFIIWDELFTRLGVWAFNPAYVSGIYFLHLPVEELLFFICIPYACVFTYFCIGLFIKSKWNYRFENILTPLFILFLVLAAVLNYHKIYTSVTFFSLAILLVSIKYIFRVQWLPQFYFAYLLLLIPFLITNGILTGTGLSEPVVIYNDLENTGLRILTIPVEDIFYGFELILLTVCIYEYLLRKKHA